MQPFIHCSNITLLHIRLNNVHSYNLCHSYCRSYYPLHLARNKVSIHWLLSLSEIIPIDRTPFTSTPYNQVLPAPPVQQADSMTVVLEQLVTLLSKRDWLSQIEPEIFYGDVLAFPAWLRSFESQIEAHTTTDEERLFYLGKYTTGEAKKLIN